MKRSIILLAGALAATSLVAACGDDGGGGAVSDAEYCTLIETYRAKADGVDLLLQDPTPEAVEEQFSAMQDMLEDLAAKAPEEIKDDVAAMKSGIDKSVDIFTQYDWDFNKLQVAPEFAELFSELSGEEMQAAGERLATYSEDVCGLPADS